MLTQEKIDRFYLDVNSLDIKKKVSVITRETCFPQSNVSEWLRKVKRPSEAFIDKFYEKFGTALKISTINLREDKPQATAKQMGLIEIKTASGKTVQVLPEGETEIALLNAFLEERDRVLEERNRIIEKIEKSKDELFQILNSALNQIHEDTHTALAYQKAWVRYEAERSSEGDKQKENEIRYKMSTLVDDILAGDEVSDNRADIGNPGKE